MSAELLSELARVKAVFQLRAISAVIGLPLAPIETRRAETEGLGAKHESGISSKSSRPK